MRTRVAVTALFAVVAPLAAAATAAVARPPTVQIMVVGRTRTLTAARSVTLRATSVAIGHRRCNVPAGTALAGLIDARLKPRVSNAAGCDPASWFVTKVGPDANHGFAGWEYKINHSSPSLSAGDPGGRLRGGQQLLWFWCARASACSRTLAIAVASSRPSGGTRITVTGYDDNGHGKRVAGASVHVDSTTVATGADGTATATLTPGRHAIYATKTGLIQSFPTVLTR